MVPQQEEMEDIMSSIRTTMDEEKSKVGSGSADLIEAAAAQDGAEDEDVLELTSEDMVEAPAEGAEPAKAESEELIDIAEFANSGESKPAEKEAKVDLGESEAVAEAAVDAGASGAVGDAEAVAEVAVEETVKVEEEVQDAADEFDRLLAEISEEKQNQASEAEDKKKAFLAEEEPLGGQEGPVPSAVDEAGEVIAEEPAADGLESAAAEPEVAGEPVPEGEVEAEAVAEEIQDEMVEAVADEAARYTLQTVETSDGVQVALPAEVLAMALRPMVKDWLEQNLPDVVERLVKDEITKLGQ